MPSNHLILCHPLLLLPSVFPGIRVFYSESVLHIRWQKYWSFSFSISPSSEYSGLVSLRIDWFDLVAVQGTLKGLLHTTVRKPQFFGVQPSSWSNSHIHTVQFSSVAQSRPTRCDPINRSRPGLPVHHQLPESTQTHVHCFGDPIQPSHPLSSPSPPALNLSQH